MRYVPPLIAFFVFISLQPYFTWNSKIEAIYAIVILFVVAISTRVVKKSRLLISIFAIILLIFYFSPGAIGEGYPFFNQISVCLKFVPLILLPQRVLDKSFEMFLKIFAISILPGIIYYFLIYVAGLRFEFTNIEALNPMKTALGITYKMLPGMVLLGEGFFTRFCGMFDEPGVVGTISALCIVKKGKIDSWYMATILIGGLLSLSGAFLVIVTVYTIVTASKKKIIILALSFLIVIIPAILDWEGRDIFYKYTINRFSLGSGANLDNRISDDAKRAMKQNGTGQILEFFIGHGYGAIGSFNVDISSWKAVFFDSGILGLLGYCGLMYSLVFSNKKNKQKNFLVFLFMMLSFYQRPSMFRPFYALFLASQITDS